MAEVWEAHDTRLDRWVAVKVVNLAATHDPTLGERLQREGVAIASLRHPNIVTVHDAGVEGDTAYLVMELIEGTDLGAVLKDGPLPVPHALRIGERVAGALSAAHAAGIVHRDVKLANVLLHGDDVTVVDFGIAAAAQFAGASLTDPGTVVGTAEYMAPEQAHGAEVSPASEIYALGCLITAMLTGRPPFTGAPPLEILRQHVTTDPPHLATLVPDLPPRPGDPRRGDARQAPGRPALRHGGPPGTPGPGPPSARRFRGGGTDEVHECPARRPRDEDTAASGHNPNQRTLAGTSPAR